MFDEALVLFPPAVSWKETDWSVTSSLVVYDVLNLVISWYSVEFVQESVKVIFLSPPILLGFLF